VCWKDKREVYAFSSMHSTPAEGGKAVKPLIIEDYRTLAWVIGWRTATALARKPGNGRKTLYHLLHLTILNSYCDM
jgi:hypothetical protein